MKRFVILLLAVSIITVLAIIVLVRATRSSVPPDPPVEDSQAGPPSATLATQPPTAAPTPTHEEDAPTPTPRLLSSQPTPSPTPVVDMEDLSLYQSALRPEFAADVEAASEATRYFIQATLDPEDPTSLTGVERVRYTNTETGPLDAIYFRLYPNLPGYGGSITIGQVILNGASVNVV